MRNSFRIGFFIVLLLVFTAPGGDKPVASEPEDCFTQLLDATRAANGKPPIPRSHPLDRYAEEHSIKMRADQTIYHSQGPPGTWEEAGENVGMGKECASIHAGFVNSPGHRDNLLGDWTSWGVGAVLDEDGTIFVTEVFIREAPDPPPKKKKPPKSASPAPRCTCS